MNDIIIKRLKLVGRIASVGILLLIYMLGWKVVVEVFFRLRADDFGGVITAVYIITHTAAIIGFLIWSWL